jgi:cytochrome P450
LTDSKLPCGAALTACDPAFRDDPHTVYDRIRVATPVYADPAYGRSLVTGHADVRALLRSRSYGADARNAREDSYMRRVAGTGVNEGRGDTEYAPPLVLSDDPDHRRVRSLVSKAFTPRAVAGMADTVRSVTAELLDAVAGRDEIDFIDDFAGPLPTRVIAAMMGLEGSDAAPLKVWSEAVLRGYDPDRGPERHAALREAYVAMSRLFQAAVAERRRLPGDDLISAMVRARDDDQLLSDLEIISLCVQLMVAGNVTTTDLMGNGLHALLEAPDQLARLRAEPGLIEPAVEEMLRFDCPITETARIALEDGSVHGCPVRRGDTLTLSLAAANRDPAVFDDPHRFDITRAPNPHLGFGSGIHVCLGAPLARLEAQIGLGAFIAGFPSIRPGSTAMVRRDLPFFRGFEKLPLRLSPA